MNLLDVRTPIKGLYLAGAWSHGGGYTPAMMAGRDAVQAFMEDWGS
jgi:phytoene dehydrogenase-like protein